MAKKSQRSFFSCVCPCFFSSPQEGLIEINEHQWHEVFFRFRGKLVPALKDISFLGGFKLERFSFKSSLAQTENTPREIFPNNGVALCFQTDDHFKKNTNKKREKEIQKCSILFQSAPDALTVGNLFITSRKLGIKQPETKEKVKEVLERVRGSEFRV